MSCLFCDKEQLDVLFEDEVGFVIRDKFPVNEGHLLIIPHRHVSSYFDLTDHEVLGLHHLARRARGWLEKDYEPDGYNLGVNVDAAGGQTIFHVHLHLIPRYSGDVEDPRGGLRNLKPQLVPYKG